MMTMIMDVVGNIHRWILSSQQRKRKQKRKRKQPLLPFAVVSCLMVGVLVTLHIHFVLYLLMPSSSPSSLSPSLFSFFVSTTTTTNSANNNHTYNTMHDPSYSSYGKNNNNQNNNSIQHQLQQFTNNNNNDNKKKKKASSPSSSAASSSLSTTRPELSACLIVMDDNHFLIEWIAYHYHKVNLRYLILASDPNSKTTPTNIVRRWQDRMMIEEWTTNRYMSRPTTTSTTTQLKNHNKRQSEFNLECLRHLKELNRTWTLLIDTDEYLLTNQYYNKTIHTNTDPDTENITTTTITDVPTLLQILDEDTTSTSTSTTTTTTIEAPNNVCIPIHRIQFSAHDSSHEQTEAQLPKELRLTTIGTNYSVFRGANFQTLRWRKIGFHETWYTSKWGFDCGIVRHIPNKVLVNLQHVQVSQLVGPELVGAHHDNNNNKKNKNTTDHKRIRYPPKIKNTGNPHQPLALCSNTIYSSIEDTYFVLHHYMGTPEQWFYRSGDKRGLGYRRARYEDYNQRIGAAETDIIRPWLQGFIDAVGTDEAQRLLKDVGQLETVVSSSPTVIESDSSSSLLSIEEQKKRNTINQSVPSSSSSIYKIGDVVNVNYAGTGNWQPGEIYACYSNNYYSVVFEDCTQEITTNADRMKPL